MAQKSFYLDTCIWLNLFKKEGDKTKGVPYWKSASDFIHRVSKDNNRIIVSTIILKELKFTAEEKFEDIMKFFKDSEFIKIIKTTNEDYDFARRLESDEDYKISFYDYLHIGIVKRLKIPLITRDKDMIKVAEKLVEVNKPEDLLS